MAEKGNKILMRFMRGKFSAAFEAKDRHRRGLLDAARLMVYPP